MAGKVVRVGWMDVEGFDEEQFAAIVVFDEPPDMSCSVVWNAVPVEIIEVARLTPTSKGDG